MSSKDRNVIAITVENEDEEEERFIIASLRLEGVEQVSAHVAAADCLFSQIFQVPLQLPVQAPAKFELLKGYPLPF